MKKLSLLICLFALAISNIMAGPVDAQRAQQIGTKFMKATVLGEQRADIQLNLVHSQATRGDIDYYVFNVVGGGFVVIAGDDCVKPILAYSTEGSFDASDISEGFSYTLNGYSKEIQYVRENNIPASFDIITEWKSVADNGIIRKGFRPRAVVGPICQTTWNQNYPYNNQCPEDEEGSGGYVYAGCVATATAQVMKFHEYPERGTGSYSYTPDGYETQTANFGETDYHFELMPLDLDSTSTEEEVFYIAQLLHHLGISVEMQYSGHGSGAYSYMVVEAVRDYFGYSCDEHITNYSYWGWYGSYTDEEWIQMLKDGGLDENLPLYYDGQDTSGAGGHAFVCDGYDENDYFHFNWGWSGRDDAWCAFGALNTTKYNFNESNGFIGHMVPDNDVYYQRPDSISDFTVTEDNRFDGVTVSWTNPSHMLNGEELGSISSITVRRNYEVIATIDNVQPGENMTYEDSNLEPGLYEYSIFVTNESGISRTAYRSILVGEKCDITFVLRDEAGDGWKGAAISVATETGERIAVVTMKDGSEETVTVPLLSQNLSFIWNHGWYHNTEEYDTDFECSFDVLNANGDVLYTSDELADGIFLNYDNTCGDAVPEAESISCNIYPNPTNGIVNISGEGMMKINVLNVLGQKIYETSANGFATIDLSSYESAMYMIQVVTEKGTKVEKINLNK